MGDPISARSNRGQTLRNKFESEKRRLSYTDYHYEDVKARLNMSSSPSNQTGKVGDQDEIIKYMSNLPSYLETRKDIPDKALNFGVMDWEKLQKWQYQHLNSSPLVSTERSTAQSTKSQRCFPAGQRSHGVTLQSHFNASSCLMNVNKLQESESLIDRGKFKSNSGSLKGKMKIQDTFCRTPDLGWIRNRVFHGNSETDERNHSCKDNNRVKEKRSSFSSMNSDLDMRSKSPIRRFSFGKTKRTESPISRKAASNDNTLFTKRFHSSPLRRVFEPLFQSKATDSRQFTKKPHEKDMCETTSTRQALFRSAVKNERPLFTFATENNDNILAAYVWDLSSSGKDFSNSWIYTMYTIDEIKKKNTSWLPSTRKDKDHSNGYASNVTAQMTVTNRSAYNSDTREFSLFRVGPHDELAAIVVKFPRNVDDEEQFSTTVILPGGNHGVSSDSKPSRLTDRWRSGGVCDCGGWDLGCRVRTLTNQVQSSGRSNSPNGPFELFFEGEVMNKKCFFRFCSMKEGMFSVEYDSTVSALQAFSICVSVVECRKSCEHQESATYVAKQVKNDVNPVHFASFPPLSPVGRV